MDAVQIASIVVSIIAAAAAIASQRAAAKASTTNARVASETEKAKTQATAEVEKEKSRLEAEKDAYARARAMDIQTIERQGAEIAEVRAQNIHLNEDVKRVARDNEELHRENSRLREEVMRLRTRVRRLEGGRGNVEGDILRSNDYVPVIEDPLGRPDEYRSGPPDDQTREMRVVHPDDEYEHHQPPMIGGVETEPMEVQDGEQ